MRQSSTTTTPLGKRRTSALGAFKLYYYSYCCLFFYYAGLFAPERRLALGECLFVQFHDAGGFIRGRDGQSPSHLWNLPEQIATPGPKNVGDYGKPRLKDRNFSERRARALPLGRPVKLLATQVNREKRIIELCEWMKSRQLPELDEVLNAAAKDATAANVLLCAYGRYLWHAEATYGRFAEVVNAIQTRQPLLRRQLGPVWGLGFQWRAAEPSNSHLAVPQIILKALFELDYFHLS